MRITIEGSTARPGEPALCLTCRHSVVAKGVRLRDEIVECGMEMVYAMAPGAGSLEAPGAMAISPATRRGAVRWWCQGADTLSAGHTQDVDALRCPISSAHTPTVVGS